MQVQLQRNFLFQYFSNITIYLKSYKRLLSFNTFKYSCNLKFYYMFKIIKPKYLLKYIIEILMIYKCF